YAAALAGRPAGSALPPPARQYADFARWQRERAGTAEYRRQLAWWVAQLTPVPPPLVLPVDRARPPGPSPRGGVQAFDWGVGMARSVAGLAEFLGVKPSAVLLATYAALLHRYSGEDRVAVTVPVAVRPGSEFAGVVGQFSNPLVHC